MLVQELRRIESTLPQGGHVATPIEHLRICQQLLAKEEECRQKDEVLREKDVIIREKDEAMKGKDEAMKEKDEALKEKEIVMRAIQADTQQLRGQNSIIRPATGSQGGRIPTEG